MNKTSRNVTLLLAVIRDLEDSLDTDLSSLSDESVRVLCNSLHDAHKSIERICFKTANEYFGRPI